MVRVSWSYNISEKRNDGTCSETERERERAGGGKERFDRKQLLVYNVPSECSSQGLINTGQRKRHKGKEDLQEEEDNAKGNRSGTENDMTKLAEHNNSE